MNCMRVERYPVCSNELCHSEPHVHEGNLKHMIPPNVEIINGYIEVVFYNGVAV